MIITVIIPTYNRLEYLPICLDSLKQQNKTPDETIIVIRDYDVQTISYLKKQKNRYKGINAKIAQLHDMHYSFVDALNLGIRSANGDILVFTDDDAFADADWLSRIENHFITDDKLGVLGGPVIPYRNGKADRVYVKQWGRLTWYGAIKGETTSIPGKMMECDVVRGANMSIRKKCILPFDTNLLPYWAKNEETQTFRIKQSGYNVLTDPDIGVLHYSAPTVVGRQSDEAVFGYAFNLVYVYLRHLPFWIKLSFFLNVFFWWNGQHAGIIKFALKLIMFRQKSIDFHIFLVSLRGKIAGLFYLLSRQYKYKEFENTLK